MEDVDILKLDGHGLRIFLTVLEAGSMTGAALQLGLNQSTVSHAIDKLRSALRDPLFVRVGRNIVPTAYAMALEGRVRTILADLEGLPAQAEFDPAHETGTFTVAANATELTPELLILWDRLRERAPEMNLLLLELGSRGNAETVLTDARADLIIAVNATRYPPELNAVRLFEDGFAVFYDPNARGPVHTVEEYCAAEHGALDFGGRTPSIVELNLRDMRLSRHIRLRVPNAFSLAGFMKGSQLICTMQTRLHFSVFSGLARCPVPFAMPSVRFDMVWHRRDETAPRNMWLRQVLLDVFREFGLSPGGSPVLHGQGSAQDLEDPQTRS